MIACTKHEPKWNICFFFIFQSTHSVAFGLIKCFYTVILIFLFIFKPIADLCTYVNCVSRSMLMQPTTKFKMYGNPHCCTYILMIMAIEKIRKWEFETKLWSRQFTYSIECAAAFTKLIKRVISICASQEFYLTNDICNAYICAP